MHPLCEIALGGLTEAYKHCEIKRKFNQLSLRLFKAFMSQSISIILMYIKTNTIFGYRRA